MAHKSSLEKSQYKFNAASQFPQRELPENPKNIHAFEIKKN